MYLLNFIINKNTHAAFNLQIISPRLTQAHHYFYHPCND